MAFPHAKSSETIIGRVHYDKNTNNYFLVNKTTSIDRVFILVENHKWKELLNKTVIIHGVIEELKSQEIIYSRRIKAELVRDFNLSSLQLPYTLENHTGNQINYGLLALAHKQKMLNSKVAGELKDSTANSLIALSGGALLLSLGPVSLIPLGVLGAVSLFGN